MWHNKDITKWRSIAANVQLTLWQPASSVQEDNCSCNGCVTMRLLSLLYYWARRLYTKDSIKKCTHKKDSSALIWCLVVSFDYFQSKHARQREKKSEFHFLSNNTVWQKHWGENRYSDVENLDLTILWGNRREWGGEGWGRGWTKEQGVLQDRKIEAGKQAEETSTRKRRNNTNMVCQWFYGFLTSISEQKETMAIPNPVLAHFIGTDY